MLFLCLALVFELLAKLLLAQLFREGLRPAGISLKLRPALKAALTGSAVSRLLPAGGALTPSAMGWAARAEADHAAGAALRATVLTYGGLVAGTGGALLWGGVTGRQPLLFAGAVVIGGAMVVIGVAVLAGGRFVAAVVNRLPSRLRTHFAPTLHSGRADLRELGLVAARVAAEAAVLWSALHALSIELTPSQTMVAYGVSTIVGGLPGLPGGIGLIEGGLVGVLTALGFGLRGVVAPVLIYRIIDYWIIAGVGLVAGSMAAREPERELVHS